ncbi:MAG: 4-alpha-glucanotransferase, partial [Bacteroidales bacterium]
MKIKFELNYHTSFGEELFLLGDVDALGNDNCDRALKMNYVKDGTWTIQVAVPKKNSIFSYEYIVKRGDDIVRKTSLKYHFEKVAHKDNYVISDRWLDIPVNKPFFSSAFTDSFFARKSKTRSVGSIEADRVLRFIVSAPTVPPVCDLAIVGDGALFANWQVSDSLKFDDSHFPYWTLDLDLDKVISGTEYKLVMINKESGAIYKWEEGENRVINLSNISFKNYCYVINIPDFRDYSPDVRYAGTAIPVFSLRSNSSFGIGDFGDLYKFVDWVKLTDQSIIQILPINDTTMTHTWVDSYPYNANSIYALHPAYIDLSQLPPIQDPVMAMEYKRTQPELNALAEVDYDRVTELKWAFLKQIFKESGNQITDSKEYKVWFESNKEWLESYAAFSYLRDIFHTPVFMTWKKMSVYKQKEIDQLVAPDSPVYKEIQLYYFVQFELHRQLLRVRNYAHSKGVILKGDIPIGISRNSVEAWKEPYLFNLYSQAGAPPDDFSANGQNWGFPTYNWSEMKRTNYAWWKKRFAKMADYFDAYRIDHLLGFFRIWEIPMDSVQGLLGHFNPALPYSRQELEAFGFYLDEERHLEPYIRGHFLYDFFGDYTQEVIDNYLNEVYPGV